MVKLLKGRMSSLGGGGLKRPLDYDGTTDNGSLGNKRPTTEDGTLVDGEAASAVGAAAGESDKEAEMHRAVELQFDPRRIDKDRNVREMQSGGLHVVRCDFLKVVHDSIGNPWINDECRKQFKPPFTPRRELLLPFICASILHLYFKFWKYACNMLHIHL